MLRNRAKQDEAQCLADAVKGGPTFKKHVMGIMPRICLKNPDSRSLYTPVKSLL